MKTMKRYAILHFLLFFLSVNAFSQDLHYSQFYNSPLNLNPALTGIFNGDQRFMASVRDQWRFVPVPWFTFSGSYDFKIYPENEKEFFGLGFNFNYDRQGDSRLTLASLNVSGSYSRVLHKNHVISGGILLGLGNRGFNLNNLTWDKQWDGEFFNPGAGSGENFDVRGVTFLETAAGVNYRLQKDTRTKLDLGAGFYHLTRPQTNFYNTENQKLPINTTLSAVGSVQLTSALDLQVHALQQLQGSYRETVLGALGKIYVSQQRGKETIVQVGMGYRTAGSYIPTVGLEYVQWYVGFSYDADSTEINDVLNTSKGGPEIHVRYIISKVKSLKTLKVCPIF